MVTSAVERMSSRLDEQESNVRRWEMRYNGETPLSFLSQKDREALGNRLTALSVNFSRLVVDVLAERLCVSGFMLNGEHDPALWEAWRSLAMQDGSAQVHTDALAVGRSFVTVWGDGYGPTVTAEAPAQVTVERHPVTREVTAALKRWQADGKAYAVLFTPEDVTTYESKSHVGDGGMIPATGWTTIDKVGNPFRMVPVVPFVNRGRVTDVLGVSEMQPVADLSDAITKAVHDAMVTSEAFARPRRWASGIEPVFDEEGNEIPPFSDNSPLKLWVAEQADARFGQFSGSDASGYTGLVTMLTQQLAALAGVPAQSLGLGASEAMSADAIRAAEASLISKAHARMITFGRSWSMVAALMHSAMTGADPRRVRAEVVWSDPSTRSEAATADAVTKLYTAGSSLRPRLRHGLATALRKSQT